MAERIQQAQMLPGDTLDVVFSIEKNDHPDYGGLELTLRDFRPCTTNQNAAAARR